MNSYSLPSTLHPYRILIFSFDAALGPSLLMRPPIEHDQLQSKPLLQASLVAALPSNHRLAAQQSLTIQSLQAESFISFPRAMATRLYDQIISLCHQGDFSPHVVQQAAQMQTILSLVAAEIGIAIVPESLQNLQRRGVSFIPFKAPTPQAEVYIVWKQHQMAPTIETFLQGMPKSSLYSRLLNAFSSLLRT